MPLAVYEHINTIRDWVSSRRSDGATIGIVPTMGALHPGHISLVELALKQSNFVVVSIFVNPTQFNNQEDLKKYPRTLEADLKMLEASGCHAVFCPNAEEMYGGVETTGHWDFGAMSRRLEGSFRPGHFDGVLTIVKKLFEAVTPDKAFFGEKDFQQLSLIQKLTALEHLPVEIVSAPTMRETDGLAMSSRNVRLNEQDRSVALNISRVLLSAQKTGRNVPPSELNRKAEAALKNTPGMQLEYCALVKASDFESFEQWPAERTVLLVAAFVGGVRLIDNVIID